MALDKLTLIDDSAISSIVTTAINNLAQTNYIAYPVAVGNPLTNGWRVYKNTDAVVPTTGTGGSPVITLTQNTSSPLNSTGDFRITKTSGASRRGEGISTDFTIANRHLAKVLQISFDYEVIAGSSLATDDLRVYIIQDPSGTPAVIEPVNVSVQGVVSGNRIRHLATFQTHISITSYRLCIHVATSTNSNQTIDFNNFRVWEQSQSVGAIITDWQSYTLTIGATTTPPTEGAGATKFARWRRVGSNAEIHFEYAHSNTGGAGNGTYLFPLPPGLVIDTSALANLTNTGNNIVGYASAVYNSAAYVGTVIPWNSTNLAIQILNDTIALLTIGSSTANLANNPVRWTFRASVPIQGWGSSVAMSSDTGDGRLIAFRASPITGVASSAIIGSSGATIQYDTHGAWNSGVYTIPISGVYRFTILVRGGGNATWFFRKSGTNILLGVSPSGLQYVQFSGSDFFNAGQTLSFLTNDTTITDTGNFISIERISAGSQQIATSETVACSYWLTTSTESTTNPIPFGGSTGIIGRIYDTHGSMINGTFTAPMNGIYLLTGHIATNTSGNWVEVWIGGFQNRRRFLIDSDSYVKNICIQLRLLAGQTLQLRPFTAFVVNGGTLDSGASSQIEITRIGS